MEFAALAWLVARLQTAAWQAQASIPNANACAVVQRRLRSESLPADASQLQRFAWARKRAGPSLGRLCLYLVQQRRAALLHDFLVRAATERVRLLDERVYRLSPGVLVGPAVVTTDFVGSPIVRVRVANLTSHPLMLLLEVNVADGAGRQSGASTVVRLAADEARTFELLCPDDVSPARLTWHAMPL